MSSEQQVQASKPNSGFLGNLAFNIVIPVLILSKFSDDSALGPVWSIVVALAFPIGYGLYDLRKAGKVNGFSILGIVSVLLTGGISLLQLDPKYIAYKEAAIPGLIGLAVIVSQYTRKPLVKAIVFNEQLFQVEKIHQHLDERGQQSVFEKRLKQVSYIVASSFFLSATLNYVLAKIILVSPPGTVAYSEELGKMTALSYPVIMVPSMVVLMTGLWFLISSMRKLTGLTLEELMVGQ